MGVEDGKPAAGHDPSKGFFNKFCFGWMFKHVSSARKGVELDPKDMGMPHENLAHVAYDKFAAHWAAENKLKDSPDGGKPSLFRALRKSFGWYYMVAGLCKLGWSTFVILGAFYFVRRWD